MKALVYTDTERVEYRDHPEAEAGPGETRVRIEAVGICGSDMHAYLGHDPRRVPPLILGHEAAGTAMDGALCGRQVVINPLITCGECNDCLGGRANLCHRRDLIGMYRPGAFADSICVPQRNLVPVPEGMDPRCAALTEPAATALHAVDLAARIGHRSLSDLRALVIGAGSVGLFAALSLADRGVGNVVLAESNPLRRRTAESVGVCRVIDPGDAPPEESAFEVVIDAVGGGATRGMSMRSVSPGGVVVHIGLLDNEPGFDARKMTLQEITVVGTYTYTPVDFRMTVNKLHSGAFGELDWFEERPLSEGAGAFSDLLNGRCAAPKIVLRP